MFDIMLVAFYSHFNGVGWAIKELSEAFKELAAAGHKDSKLGTHPSWTFCGNICHRTETKSSCFDTTHFVFLQSSVYFCTNSEFICYRKLHKDEIRQQKMKALSNRADTDSGSDMEIDSGFSVPGRIWNKLYR